MELSAAARSLVAPLALRSEGGYHPGATGARSARHDPGGCAMSRTVKAALLQTDWSGDQESMIDKHEEAAREASAQGAEVVCFQELFYGPYFCQVQDAEYYSYTEPIPEGPTTKRFQSVARELGMVMVLPVFDTAVGRVGVYICYDRHFPEGWRILGLHGAEIVFNPSATHRGLSEYIWRLEQPAAAVANMYYVGAINRVGIEPLGENDFYGQSYFVDPEGQFVCEVGDAYKPELIVRELDLDKIREVRDRWAFYRDRQIGR